MPLEPTTCPENCDCTSCENVTEEFANMKITRVCAPQSPSDVIDPEVGSNPKDDNTFDCITQASIVPVVGSSFPISVNNASIYSVGQWLEFFNTPAPYRYRITGVDTDENTLTLLNSFSDGTTPIPGNPSAGTTIASGSCFSIVDSVSFTSDEYEVEELARRLRLVDEVCFEGISQKTLGISNLLSFDSDEDCTNKLESVGGNAPQIYQAETNGTFVFPAHKSAIASTTGFKVGFLNLQSGLLEFAGSIFGPNKTYNITTDVNGIPKLIESPLYNEWLLSTPEFLIGNDDDGSLDYAVKNTVTIPSPVVYNISTAVPLGASHAVIEISLSQNTAAGVSHYALDINERMIASCIARGDGSSNQTSYLTTATVPITNPESSPTVTLDFRSRDASSPFAEISSSVRVTARIVGFKNIQSA